LRPFLPLSRQRLGAPPSAKAHEAVGKRKAYRLLRASVNAHLRQSRGNRTGAQRWQGWTLKARTDHDAVFCIADRRVAAGKNLS
jgi:hypothetical protein